MRQDVIRTKYDKEMLIERLSKQYPRSTHDSTSMKIYTCVAPFRQMLPIVININLGSLEQGTDVKFSVKPVWLYRVIVALLTIMPLYALVDWMGGKGDFLSCILAFLFPFVVYMDQLWQVKECKNRFMKYINGLG